MNRGNPWIGGLVGLCLAAVVFLLATAPAGAEPPASVVQTTLEDFNAGSLYHTGLTRDDDGEVQLLVVGLAGEWITGTNVTGLEPRDSHTAVQHNGHILVLAGRKPNLEASNKVFYTTINTETHDLADWAYTTPLPDPPYTPGVYGHASVVAHDRVYVLGGRSGAGTLADVQFAPIQANGTLGAWQATTPLSVPLRFLQAAVVSDTIYVIGGRDSSNHNRDEVYYAAINPGTGQLSAWQTTTPYVHGVIGHMVGVHENILYVMGGWPLPPLSEVSPWVRYATANPGGGLSSWTAAIDMRYSIYAGSGLSYNGQLYTTGGAQRSDELDSPSPYVGASLIYPGGSIGSWVNTKTIEPERMWHATVHSDDGWLYVINGSNGALPINPASINRGATAGSGGDSFAAEGSFTSSQIDLGERDHLVALTWNATISDTSLMTLTMRYRTRDSEGELWSEWHGPYPSSPTSGTVTTTHSLEGTGRYFQYQAHLGTDDLTQTPILNRVEVVSYKPTYELTLHKDSMPPPGSVVVPGSRIYYTLTYSNGVWGMPADLTTIVDWLPDYTDYVPGSISGGGTYDPASKLLRWGMSTVPPGQEGTVTFAVDVTSALPMGIILVNTATITSTSGPDRESNTVSHLTEAPELILAVTKDAQPPGGSSVEPGSRITYTISYGNVSLAYASQVALTDTHDAHGSYQVLSSDPPPNGGADNVWNLGAMAPEDQGLITIVVQLTDTLPNHWIVRNEATLGSLGASVTFSDVVTHMVISEGATLPDLYVQDIRWEPPILKPGIPITFYATVENSGTHDADTWFYASLYIKPAPSDPPFGPSDHDQGVCVDDCADPRWNYVHYIGSLPQGEQTEIRFSGADILFPVEGPYDVYIQIDVAFNDPHYNWYWGVFPEEYESNNILHSGVFVTEDEGYTIYVPLVRKD